jgi:outer membrane immunogenic protein
MNKLVVATFALATFTGSAFAADLPVKAAPPPIASVYDWTSFYIGVAGGWASGHATQSDALPFSSGQYNVHGGLIGATYGSNWQFGRMVLGLESDLSWASIKGSTTGTNLASGPCGGLPPHCESEIRWLGTSRARVGFAFDRVLPFVTAGIVDANLHGQEGTTTLAGAVGSGSKLVWGWTVGAGVEAVIAPRWSVKAEYLYVDLGKHGVFTDTIGPVRITENIKMQTSIVRVGINYKLGTSLMQVLGLR